MHIYCPTDRALVLLALPHQGVLRFPSEGGALPGVSLAVRARHPINEQIAAKAGEIIGSSFDPKQLEIDQAFIGMLAEDSVSLYLARYFQDVDVAGTEIFGALLAQMPKSRERLPYLRAFQRLMGADQAMIKVVESKDLKP